MAIFIGFLIALGIGLTGVGGGVITAPVLILFLHLPVAEAVGTALLFVAAVKIFAVPVYLWRHHVNLLAARSMLMGGIPGVLTGSLLFNRLAGKESAVVLASVGAMVAISASFSLLRFVRKRGAAKRRHHPGLLAVCSSIIGLEVGFSSAGAGALGSVALLELTNLSPAEVVGTDLTFGFVLALLAGGFHLVQGTFSLQLALQLITGGIFGAALGAYLAGTFPKQMLRLALSLWLVWLGSQLCYRGLLAMARSL